MKETVARYTNKKSQVFESLTYKFIFGEPNLLTHEVLLNPVFLSDDILES